MKKKILLILTALVLIAGLFVVTGCGKSDEDIQKLVDTYVDKYQSQLKGEKGDTGTQGMQGIQGVDGEKGEKGDKGDKGEKGDVGEQGIQGDIGATGATGIAGAPGMPGTPGAPGSTTTPVFKVELQVKTAGQATAIPTTAQVYTGTYSAYLQTTGTVGNGDEARLVLTPYKPMTLGQISTIAWQEYLNAGYPPHVDIRVDTDGDGITDDALVIEYAYNGMTHYTGGAPMPYGALTGAWYATFSDDGNGQAQVDNTAYAWQTTGAAGVPGGAFGDGDHWGDTLGNWKAGLTCKSGKYISASTLVTAIEIEVDNWVVQSDAYLDAVMVNGIVVWQ